MNRELNELLAEIRRLQEEVEKRWDELRKEFSYTLEGHKVRFESEVKRLHKKYKTGAFRYLLSIQPKTLLSLPFIYGMSIPLFLLDATITLYQQVCFRIYGITPVKRSDHIVIDRHQLRYLNVIEKFNCIYCGYANGMIGYAREIIARTEAYWCPIKHARRVLASHQHYSDFAEYGDAENYQKKLEALRKTLADLEEH